MKSLFPLEEILGFFIPTIRGKIYIFKNHCYDKQLFCANDNVSCFVCDAIARAGWVVWSGRRERRKDIGEEGRIYESSVIRSCRAGSNCDCWTGFNFLRTVIRLWTMILPCERTVPSNCTVLSSPSTFSQLSICGTLLWLIDSVFVYRLCALLYM